MEQDLVEIIEKRLLDNRKTHFRGTARVRFENLEFRNLYPRKPNKKLVAYLKSKFKIQGYLRIKLKNRIPSLIKAKVLEGAINTSPRLYLEYLLDNHLKEPPKLKFPLGFKIEYL
jgi:hypothetical protein